MDVQQRFEEQNSPLLSDGLLVTGKAGTKASTANTWRIWSKMPSGTVWEVVALHCWLDPDVMNEDTITLTELTSYRSCARFYQERMRLAIQHIADGILECEDDDEPDLRLKVVKLTDYAEWALRHSMPLPPEFPRPPWAENPAGEVAPKRSTAKWPWGSHDTELLNLLAGAAAFWKSVDEGGLYDPSDPATAPTNEQVEAWLEKKGVSKKVRESMATILRANGMPSGPRPYRA